MQIRDRCKVFIFLLLAAIRNHGGFRTYILHSLHTIVDGWDAKFAQTHTKALRTIKTTAKTILKMESFGVLPNGVERTPGGFTDFPRIFCCSCHAINIHQHIIQLLIYSTRKLHRKKKRTACPFDIVSSSIIFFLLISPPPLPFSFRFVFSLCLRVFRPSFLSVALKQQTLLLLWLLLLPPLFGSIANHHETTRQFSRRSWRWIHKRR